MGNFWNKEYKRGTLRQAQGKQHLALSNNPSEDLIKFTKWLERNAELNPLKRGSSILDLGCGNGRNLIYLAKTYGIRGIGYDISSEAVRQARELSRGLPLEYEVRSIAKPLPPPNDSQDLVLDMMTSHFLSEDERKKLVQEIARVLKPGGWLFFKTFLRGEDIHAARLLRDHPAEESGTYIHPKIGVAEHVFTESEIKELLGGEFAIHKMLRSHRHLESTPHSTRLVAGKRRSISVYAERV